MTKASQDDHFDRISNLPSNVIDGILEELPIQDLVRTSILSKKWRYMWTSVPRLEFGRRFFKRCKHLGDIAIDGIITGILLLHNGPVHKFTLETHWKYPIIINSLDKWIMVLSRSGIKHLELNIEHDDPHQMSSHIFSCKKLTYLELNNFILPVPLNCCGFKNLRDLHLTEIAFQSNTLDSLISDSPLLHTLFLSHCSGFDSINAVAPNLTVLSIECGFYSVMKSICLKKAKNLVDMKLTTMSRQTDNFDESWSVLIKGVPNIRRLSLSATYIKILSAGTTMQRLPRCYDSLTNLHLGAVNYDDSKELLFIISFLKSFPYLQELEIWGLYVTHEPMIDNLEEFECNNCCFSRLRTIRIVVNSNDPGGCMLILNLIRILLKISPSLESLTFNPCVGKKSSDASQLPSISQDLLRMERASPRAKVETFCL